MIECAGFRFFGSSSKDILHHASADDIRKIGFEPCSFRAVDKLVALSDGWLFTKEGKGYCSNCRVQEEDRQLREKIDKIGVPGPEIRTKAGVALRRGDDTWQHLDKNHTDVIVTRGDTRVEVGFYDHYWRLKCCNVGFTGAVWEADIFVSTDPSGVPLHWPSILDFELAQEILRVAAHDQRWPGFTRISKENASQRLLGRLRQVALDTESTVPNYTFGA